MEYERNDGTTLTLYDAEVPVSSQTLLVPRGLPVDLVVSSGPCAPAATTTTVAP
jgi:hypothetical protein